MMLLVKDAPSKIMYVDISGRWMNEIAMKTHFKSYHPHIHLRSKVMG